MVGNLVFLAAFSLVANGEIVRVPTRGAGAKTVVSVAVVEELVKRQGASVSTDPEGGVISISSSHPAATPAVFRGFHGHRLTFVIDGKIVSVPARAVETVPFLAPAQVKRVAEALGWTADLDEQAAVLAVTRKIAQPNTPNPLDRHGIAAGATRALEGLQSPQVSRSGAGEVCGYMDELKHIWDSTEPSASEKFTIRRLADDFQAMLSGSMEKDPSEVEELKKVLSSFSAKVRRRKGGTQTLGAPAVATQVRTTGIEFLGKVQAVLKTSDWLTQQMNNPQAASKEEVEAAIGRLRQRDTEVQSHGKRINAEVVRVRSAYGCGPP